MALMVSIVTDPPDPEFFCGRNAIVVPYHTDMEL